MTPIEFTKFVATLTHNEAGLSPVALSHIIGLAKRTLEPLASGITVNYNPEHYKLVPVNATADWVNNLVQDGWDNPSATIKTIVNFAPPLSMLDVTVMTANFVFNPSKDKVPEPAFVGRWSQAAAHAELTRDELARRKNRDAVDIEACNKKIMASGEYGKMGITSPKPLANAEKSAWDQQVAGDHYKLMAIQPMEFSMKNKLNALQHTIIKYVTRYPFKNGVEDLKKGRHAIDMLIESESAE